MTKENAIGIDLGTTYSCVGVFINGQVEIIANDRGNRTTPSYVGFTDAEHLIGDAAKNQVVTNPHNTVFDFKRLLGREFDDSAVQSDMKHWPFKVISAKGGKPKVQVDYKGESKIFTPEEISSMVLLKMKETAEAFLGTTVKDAVVTVPAYFNDSQRQATKDAGFIAGLNVLRIIEEPTAAALAFGLDEEELSEHKVLVFRLGGGTFDVSILTINSGLVEVNSTAGDTHLGGEDFNTRMVDHFCAEFKRKYNKDLGSNPLALYRLRAACETAKRTLSSSLQASIEIDSLFEGIDFYTNITRECFDELCADLVRSTMNLVKNLLRDANISKDEIEKLMIVGGSTQIPALQHMLTRLFDGKPLLVHNRNAAVQGAALLAAWLTRGSAAHAANVINITPYDLTARSSQEIIAQIGKNTKTPETKYFKLDGELGMLNIYQGNRLILSCWLSNQRAELTVRIDGTIAVHGTDCDAVFVDSRLTEEEKVEAKKSFLTEFGLCVHGSLNNIQKNSILSVGAQSQIAPLSLGVETSGGVMTALIKRNTFFSNDKGRLSKDDIERMVNEAGKYKDDDEAEKVRIGAKNSLESYAFNLKQAIDGEKFKDKISADDKKKLEDKLDELLKWLDSNQTAEKDEFENHQKELEQIVNLMMFTL